MAALCGGAVDVFITKIVGVHASHSRQKTIRQKRQSYWKWIFCICTALQITEEEMETHPKLDTLDESGGGRTARPDFFRIDLQEGQTYRLLPSLRIM